MKDCFGREIKYLRLSVTDRCNLRCRYCMPAEGVPLKTHDDILSFDEMSELVKACSLLGISKVRVTGGEPLVRKDIVGFCGRIAKIEGIEEVCITTNGILLSKYALDLRRAGVSTVNISLDTLNAEKYRYITGGGYIKAVFEGIKSALDAGFEKVKLNTVLMKGFNSGEVSDLAKLTLKYPLDVRFIELMPIGYGKEFYSKYFLSNDFVLKEIPDLEEVCSKTGVSRNYRLPQGLGNVGLISAMSMSFCSFCNRIRVTADGKVKPCLYSSQEMNIKGVDAEVLVKIVKKAILNKPASYSALSDKEKVNGRSMNQIGGEDWGFVAL